MALSTDRSTATSDITTSNSTPTTLHQRRDMAMVWWSTYVSLMFLAIFVYGLAIAVRLVRDPQPVAWVAAGLGALTLLPWAIAIHGVRRGVNSRTLRTRPMATAFILGVATSLISLWAPPSFGVGALPLAFVLATAALSLKRGGWWVILFSMFLPALHLYLATLINQQPADPERLVWVTWVSFFAVIGAPTSLWIWAVMVELDTTRQQAAELAITNERLRFAADLHDVQGHHLQVISLKTDLASRLLAKDRPDAAAPHIQEAHDAAQTALQETRALVQDYRKTTLTQELNNASAVLESAGVKTTVNVPELIATWSQQPESAELGSVLGLTVREATTNILRHSNANTADFDLTFENGPTKQGVPVVELRIRNNGAAVPETETPADIESGQDGSGLDGLRRRLADVGGELSADTTAPKDFILRVSVPRSTDSSIGHNKDDAQ